MNFYNTRLREGQTRRCLSLHWALCRGLHRGSGRLQ